MQSSFTGIYQLSSQELKGEDMKNDEVFGGKCQKCKGKKCTNNYKKNMLKIIKLPTSSFGFDLPEFENNA